MKKANKLKSVCWRFAALTIGAFASAAGAAGNIKMVDPQREMCVRIPMQNIIITNE